MQTQGIDFDDSSSDPDGYNDIMAWYWDFGDGKNDTGNGVTHQYESSGDFNVTLFIIDKYGGVDTIQKTITVSDGDGNSTPGFGIILVFLAVAFLIMRKSARKSF
jgi:PKD repeat protein